MQKVSLRKNAGRGALKQTSHSSQAKGSDRSRPRNFNRRLARGSGGSPSKSSTTYRFPFKQSVTFTYAAATTVNSTVFGFDGTALWGTSTRLFDIAVCFDVWRLEKLEIMAYPYTDSTTGPNVMAMSFFVGDSSLAPSTFAEFVQLPQTVEVSARKNIPTRMIVSRKFLSQGATKWYSTFSTSGPADDISAGIFYIVPRSSSSTNITIMFSGVVEFAQPIINQAGLTVLTALGYMPDSMVSTSNNSVSTDVDASECVSYRGRKIPACFLPGFVSSVPIRRSSVPFIPISVTTPVPTLTLSGKRVSSLGFRRFDPDPILTYHDADPLSSDTSVCVCPDCTLPVSPTVLVSKHGHRHKHDKVDRGFALVDSEPMNIVPSLPSSSVLVSSSRFLPASHVERVAVSTAPRGGSS